MAANDPVVFNRASAQRIARLVNKPRRIDVTGEKRGFHELKGGDFQLVQIRWDGTGSAGTNTTDPSWAYDGWTMGADPDTDDPLFEGLQPHWRNSIPAQKAPNDSLGLITRVAGEIVLLHVLEKDVKLSCDS